MLADEHGVRVRHGETWSGLRWQDISHVDVQSPGSWLRDGRVVVVPRPVTAADSTLDDDTEGESGRGSDAARRASWCRFGATTKWRPTA